MDINYQVFDKQTLISITIEVRYIKKGRSGWITLGKGNRMNNCGWMRGDYNGTVKDGRKRKRVVGGKKRNIGTEAKTKLRGEAS